ncbi:MAG: hypothetical protein BWK78_02150 [Thiotrichaceae bacterium IS1]|nr:MAG: hypothetical protein BWK78_02150 [Thiotrichaceae bacterium IS1]
MILTGDIGKVKTLLALFSQEKEAKEVARREFYNKEYASLQEIISVFLKKNESPLKEEPIFIVCFGIAGPNINGNCQIYEPDKLDWQFTIRELRELLTANYVEVLNDMPALGYAIPKLAESDLVSFNPNVSAEKGNRAVSLATGTGLGELLLYRDRSGDFLPSPSEGGHANFAPRDNWGLEFLTHLYSQFSPPISWEKVISWSGLQSIYGYLKDRKGVKETDAVKNRLNREIPHEVILDMANQNDELCQQSLKCFASLYGAGVGDLALRTLAVNGVYIGGGMVQDILKKEITKHLFIEAFMNAFKDKEGFDKTKNFSKRNAAIPVKAFINQEMVLMGALQRARIMANLD